MSRKRKFGARKDREKRQLPVLEGTVQMTREGFAFIIVEGEDDDVYVRASKIGGALHGDRVRVAVTREKTEKSRREGYVVEIVERSKRPFVGILHIFDGQAWVLMQSRNMPYDIVVSDLDRHPDAETGMKVAAIVDCWKKGDSCPTGHIVDVLGMPGENETEMHAILSEFGLPYRFEPEVENAADKIPVKIPAGEYKIRRDFTKTLTFTIDPADAKDFDDALSFKKLDNGNYEVGIHIADVSYYVQPGSAVDEEARTRGTSVYLVDRTVPMLPEKLCNRLCSLRPHERKLTFSAVFEITPLARVVTRWFGRTIIDSDYRFAYDGAQTIIETGKVVKGYATSADGVTTVVPEEVQEAVLVLDKLASKLRKKRFASGAISFERPEMKVEVDEFGRPVGVVQKVSKEANWLIEEFMLLANRCVAEFVATGANLDKDGYAVTGKAPAKGWKEEKTFVYRVHDEPDMTKIDNLRGFVGNFGYTLGKVADGKEFSKELNGLFNAAKDKPEFNAIELLSLRTMAKARYDVDNIGHYGLAFTYYTHFTSPIRRYPDLMVHRLLAAYLAGCKSADRATYEAACKYASQREVVAAEAERASIKYKIVEFMQDKVGNEFEGHISGLTEWGMYVEIEPTKIEGMVPLRDVRSDFFQFDDEHYRLVGRRTGKVYNLGDAVRVKVKKANQEQCLLDYELVEPDAPERGERRHDDRMHGDKEGRGRKHGGKPRRNGNGENRQDNNGKSHKRSNGETRRNSDEHSRKNGNGKSRQGNDGETQGNGGKSHGRRGGKSHGRTREGG